MNAVGVGAMSALPVSALEVARGLPIWSVPVEPRPVAGGITNANFVVEDCGRRCFVRVGADIPVHGIMRAHEAQASAAAAACGLSPALLHVVPGDHAGSPGALVFAYVAGRTLAASDLRDRAMLARVLALLRTCHRDMPRQLRGAVLLFWVFQVLRDYARTLAESDRHRAALPALADAAAVLERAVGPVELVFGHNDLLPANLIDDGARLWLVDWEYAGFNSPLFDLANLASNCALAEADERWLLEAYFAAPPDAAPLNEALWRRYQAMKCASLLRETMWSMVQETHGTVDFDYAAYTADYRARFADAYASFQKG
jgi:thiamine kinase-like enzyme